MLCVPHEYGPTRVGHGEAQCIHCLGTNRENAIIAPNHCKERAAKLRAPNGERMDTKDIPKSGPSDWRREPSERRNAVLGKLAEEAAELAARCARCMIQGLEALDPESGRPNVHHLEDEVADVQALIDLAQAHLGLSGQMLYERRRMKLRYKAPWIEALPDGEL